MNKTPYSYSRQFSTRYRFISTGVRPIEKVVEFTPLNIKNIYNLGFGDQLPGKLVDDKANSNNGDIIRVLTTIVHIIKDFTSENPEAKIVFTGSTPKRTRLYQRILKTYYDFYRKDFTITALSQAKDGSAEELFDPNSTKSYLAFFIKRKV